MEERRREYRWNWHKFLIKLTSRQFWIWIVTTIITYHVLLIDGDHEWLIPVIYVWGATTLLYLMGHVVVDAIATAVRNAEIKIGKAL